MEYMILINSDETLNTTTDGPAPGTPEFMERMAPWFAFNQRLIDGGHYISGGSLAPTTAATTVRVEPDAKPVVTDGPFIETKEQLGGFYLITAADLDEALELASAVPIGSGSMEVRPIAFRPDAQH